MSSKSSKTFYQLTNEEWCRAWEALKPSEIKILYYLRTLHPFGGELKLKISDVAETLRLNRSTVSRGLGRLAKEGWVHLETVSLTLIDCDRSTPDAVIETQGAIAGAKDAIVETQGAIAEARGAIAETPTVIAKSHSPARMPSPKAIQPGAYLEDYLEDKKIKTTQAVDENFQRTVTKTEFPLDLKQKLEELTILDGSAKDSVVYRAIASGDISQAYGAANHVELSFETCSNPRSIFLYQLKRQPVERMGNVQFVTAADSPAPIETIKRMYGPARWKEAAEYSGYSKEAIALASSNG